MVPDENLSQLPTSPEEPRLHRTDRAGQDHGDLLIRKVVDLAKNNDLTPEIGEFLECPGQQLTQFSTLHIGICAVDAGGPFDNLKQDIFASARHRDSPVFPAIDGHAIQPRVELALTAKSPDGRMCLDTDVLEEIIRNVTISRQPIQGSEDPFTISSQEERKSLVIALTGAGYKRRIRLREVDSSRNRQVVCADIQYGQMGILTEARRRESKHLLTSNNLFPR